MATFKIGKGKDGAKRDYPFDGDPKLDWSKGTTGALTGYTAAVGSTAEVNDYVVLYIVTPGLTVPKAYVQLEDNSGTSTNSLTAQIGFLNSDEDDLDSDYPIAGTSSTPKTISQLYAGVEVDFHLIKPAPRALKLAVKTKADSANATTHTWYAHVMMGRAN